MSSSKKHIEGNSETSHACAPCDGACASGCDNCGSPSAGTTSNNGLSLDSPDLDIHENIHENASDFQVFVSPCH